jgi:outer membrane protein assembly factor BamA
MGFSFHRVPGFRISPIIAIVLLAVPAWHRAGAQEFTLRAVRFSGSQRFGEKQIVEASGLHPGGAVSVRALDEAASRLSETGVFAEITFRYETLGTSLNAYYQLKDVQEVLPCRFENYVWSPDAEVIAALKQRVPLFDGRVPSSGKMIESIAASLEKILAERGVKARFSFQLHIAGIGRPVDAVSFRVEDLQIPITQVELSGASAAVLPALQEQIDRLKTLPYERGVVETYGSYNFAPAYHRRGFLRVAFGAPAVRPLGPPADGRQPVAVTIAVSEGQQYRLAQIVFEGYRAAQPEDLRKLLHAKAAEIIDAVQLQDDVRALSTLYGTRGYLHANARAIPQMDDQQLTVSYTVQITEGDLYRMGKIEVRGFDDATNQALAKMWKLKPGDPYDNSYRTRYFQDARSAYPRTGRPVRYTLQQKEQPDHTVDVTIQFTS